MDERQPIAVSGDRLTGRNQRAARPRPGEQLPVFGQAIASVQLSEFLSLFQCPLRLLILRSHARTFDETPTCCVSRWFWCAGVLPARVLAVRFWEGSQFFCVAAQARAVFGASMGADAPKDKAVVESGHINQPKTWNRSQSWTS